MRLDFEQRGCYADSVMDKTIFDVAAENLPSIFLAQPPMCGVILGSGWSQSLRTGKVLARIPYTEIPGLGLATIVGHAGELVLFEQYGIRIAAFMGRRHWYEGVGWEPVVLPVELLRRMGVRNLLVTNAAGGIRSFLKPGDLMLLRDQINVTGVNPLIGPLMEGWGPRFPDQSRLYDPDLSEVMKNAAHETGVVLSEGIYVYSSGPGFETPAEIRAYAGMGADAVGMSTVHEVTVAHAAGMRVVGLSCITNMAAGISGPHLSHAEVIEQTAKSGPVMARLLDAFFRLLAGRT